LLRSWWGFPGKGFFEVAAAQLIGQRDIGVLDALEVLEVGKGFGRPQFVMLTT
jgi:hypothetical protein